MWNSIPLRFGLRKAHQDKVFSAPLRHFRPPTRRILATAEMWWRPSLYPRQLDQSRPVFFSYQHGSACHDETHAVQLDSNIALGHVGAGPRNAVAHVINRIFRSAKKLDEGRVGDCQVSHWRATPSP